MSPRPGVRVVSHTLASRQKPQGSFGVSSPGEPRGPSSYWDVPEAGSSELPPLLPHWTAVEKDHVSTGNLGTDLGTAPPGKI